MHILKNASNVCTLNGARWVQVHGQMPKLSDIFTKYVVQCTFRPNDYRLPQQLLSNNTWHWDFAGPWLWQSVCDVTGDSFNVTPVNKISSRMSMVSYRALIGLVANWELAAAPGSWRHTRIARLTPSAIWWQQRAILYPEDLRMLGATRTCAEDSPVCRYDSEFWDEKKRYLMKIEAQELDIAHTFTHNPFSQWSIVG